MLTNLDFLQPGQYWSPLSERDRLLKYEAHKKLFHGQHAEVYEEQFKRIERVIGNFGKLISYPVIINYQKLFTLKIIDLLFGEPPNITVADGDDSQKLALTEIIKNSDLINTSYIVGIDVSRFGDGLFVVKSGENGNNKISYIQPEHWFPIVDPLDKTQIQYHVIAFMVDVGTDTYNRSKKNLIVQIHEKGRFEIRQYNLISNPMNKACLYTIGNLISSQVYTTGLDDFAIIPVSNIVTSDSIYGIDDYADIDSLVAEILVRIGNISRILDKHAAPSVQGPIGCVEIDPATGEANLKMGNFFPRDSNDEAKVEYITWEGQLTAAFEELKFLRNELFLVSETGATLLGDTDKAGQASSGTALKLKMMSPTTKAKRIRSRFDTGIKKAIKLCSQLGGKNIVNLNDANVDIIWQDGLPNDDKEISDILNIRTGGKATMSVKRALMQYDQMSEEQAEEELETIAEEETATNPLKPAPFSGDNMPNEDENNNAMMMMDGVDLSEDNTIDGNDA